MQRRRKSRRQRRREAEFGEIASYRRAHEQNVHFDPGYEYEQDVKIALLRGWPPAPRRGQ